jgi:hypothetical protein
MNKSVIVMDRAGISEGGHVKQIGNVGMAYVPIGLVA